jgi:hypothetical protein
MANLKGLSGLRPKLGFVGSSGTIYGGSRKPKGYAAGKQAALRRAVERDRKLGITGGVGAMEFRKQNRRYWKGRNAAKAAKSGGGSGSRSEAARKAWVTRRGH